MAFVNLFKTAGTWATLRNRYNDDRVAHFVREGQDEALCDLMPGGEDYWVPATQELFKHPVCVQALARLP